ncbi:MAG: hypothetical protein SangKO_003280 [Sandaracinaceae bacterium]
MVLCALLAASGCYGDPAGTSEAPEAAERWARARARWHIEREPDAYADWRAIEAESSEGREARQLLSEAQPRYRAFIESVRRGEPDVWEQFERAARIAPMDPALYLPLARAFRDRFAEEPENEQLKFRAIEYYRKFLLLNPRHPAAERALGELFELDPEGTARFELPVDGGAAEAIAPRTETPSWPLWVALAALLLAVAAVARLLWRVRVSLVPLEVLAERRPELHPAITYLVGSLRHELLKHRIGAVGDAVGALQRGRATADQRAFLQNRLYGGEPLTEAWSGHLAAFERALGPELDLGRRDPAFRRAGRAIRTIASLQAGVAAGQARAGAKLADAHAELRALDRHLSQLVQRLVRTPVDGALFREVVDEVRSEYAAGEVTLDEVVIRGPSPAPMVEVFRVDLVLILKNVVRNAILAVGQDEAPRRIGLDVETAVEITGEEVVRVHVRDTSVQRFSTTDLYARKMDRGLGLVTAALARYDGAILVEDGGEGFAKSVTLRFFRAYGEDELAASA